MPIDFTSYSEWLFKQSDSFMHRDILSRRLTLGQAAIQFTRGKLRHGAGNITEQVEKSKKYSTFYTIQAYDLGDTLSQKMTSKNATLNHLAAQAIAARKVGAGNCDHFAAVSFFYLVEHLSPSDGSVFRVSVTGHSVTVLADKGWKPTDTAKCKSAVVVDAWPTNTFCVAWNDWYYRNESPTIKISMDPLSDGNTRERILRLFREDVKKDDTLYSDLRKLKQESVRHHLKYYYDDKYKEAVPSGQYPAWTDSHPLRSDHPIIEKKCFITSACTLAAGLDDNCAELTILRRFRDGYLSNEHPAGRDLIEEYYRIAPSLVEAIHARPDARTLLLELLHQVRRCVDLIVRERHLEAVVAYQEMVTSLRTRVLSKDPSPPAPSTPRAPRRTRSGSLIKLG